MQFVNCRIICRPAKSLGSPSSTPTMTASPIHRLDLHLFLVLITHFLGITFNGRLKPLPKQILSVVQLICAIAHYFGSHCLDNAQFEENIPTHVTKFSKGDCPSEACSGPCFDCGQQEGDCSGVRFLSSFPVKSHFSLCPGSPSAA